MITKIWMDQISLFFYAVAVDSYGQVVGARLLTIFDIRYALDGKWNSIPKDTAYVKSNVKYFDDITSEYS